MKNLSFVIAVSSSKIKKNLKIKVLFGCINVTETLADIKNKS